MTGIVIICMVLWAVISMLWYYYVGEGRRLNKRVKELGEIYEAQAKSGCQVEASPQVQNSSPLKPGFGNTPSVITEDEMYFFYSQGDDVIEW